MRGILEGKECELGERGGNAVKQIATTSSDFELYDGRGRRKYLNAIERRAFIAMARMRSHEVYALCWLLHDTGCRLSEALALTMERIDQTDQMIVFESLKKRREGVYRAVPCSQKLVAALVAISNGNDERLWPWHRMTAYRRIQEVMTDMNVSGPHANSRGLRHGFAVAAIENKVPLNLIQRWLGHAHISTTAIYANVVGEEEIKIASRLWNRFT